MNKNYVNEISFFREAERMSSCIEYSLSDCPSEFSWPGLAVLHPYVSLLKTIKSTICSEGKRFRDVLHKTPDFVLTKMAVLLFLFVELMVIDGEVVSKLYKMMSLLNVTYGPRYHKKP